MSRQALDGCTEAVLRAAKGAKPAILLVRHGGRTLIVKDFAPALWPLRQTYGRYIVGHECRIYRALAGVAGVPAFGGRLDAFAFAVEYVDGATLKRAGRGQVAPATFEELARLFARLHARGVVHLDAHQKTNVVVSPDGRPHLVDFATALALGTSWLARRLLVPLLAQADWLGFVKLKARYCPDALTAQEARRWKVIRTMGWLWPQTLLRRLGRRWKKRRARRRAAAQRGGAVGEGSGGS